MSGSSRANAPFLPRKGQRIPLEDRFAGEAQGAVGGVFANELFDRTFVLQPAMDLGDRSRLRPGRTGPTHSRDLRQADEAAIHRQRAAAMDISEGGVQGAAAFEREAEAGQHCIIVRMPMARPSVACMRAIRSSESQVTETSTRTPGDGIGQAEIEP